MPRLRAIETAEAAPRAKSLLGGVQKKLGMTPNLMRTMANSPAVLEAYLGFSNSLVQSSLSPKLREQIALTVGEVNRCRYPCDSSTNGTISRASGTALSATSNGNLTMTASCGGGTPVSTTFRSRSMSDVIAMRASAFRRNQLKPCPEGR